MNLAKVITTPTNDTPRTTNDSEVLLLADRSFRLDTGNSPGLLFSFFNAEAYDYIGPMMKMKAFPGLCLDSFDGQLCSDLSFMI